MIIDSHAHLDMFIENLPQVLERAKTAGVGYIITIGSDLESSEKAVSLAESHEMVYAAVGVHPHEAETVGPGTYNKLARLAQSDKVLAIGEIGLDYHYNHSPREVQRQVFVDQLNLADKLDLPVVVHSRESDRDVADILSDNSVGRKGVIHCFSGSKEMLLKCLELGYYISLSGVVTFPKATRVQQLVGLIPNDRLLVETDCPYLAPLPWRGKTNEPSYITATVEKVAALQGLNPEDIARISSLNAHNLFGIKGVDTRAKIVYPIRDSLYLNITNECTNNCRFCARGKSYYVKGHNLFLEREPLADEIIAALPDLNFYGEVVFCGFGEPFLRLETIKAVAKFLKTKGMKVRVNTNGQGNLIYGRDIVPELAGLIDAVSVSLNTPDSVQYQEICQSRYGEAAYAAMLEFIRSAVHSGIQVAATVLDMPGTDLDACAEVACQLGVPLRVRHYNQVG